MLSEKLELQITLAALKVVRNTAHGTAKVLIQSTDLPEFESTWEPVETIMKQFHSFHLEDKVTLLVGSIVRPLISKFIRGEPGFWFFSRTELF